MNGASVTFGDDGNTDGEALRVPFGERAFEYEIAARFALEHNFFGVVGQLFHHAIECYLKAELVRTRGEHVTRRLGHNLVSLWEGFKAEKADPALNAFDHDVHALNRFEELRYPEGIARTGAGIAISDQHVEMVGGNEPSYRIAPTGLDALIGAIYEASHLNREFFAQRLRGEARRYADAIMRPRT